MTQRIRISWGEFNALAERAAFQLRRFAELERRGAPWKYILGVPRGGQYVAAALAPRLGLQLVETKDLESMLEFSAEEVLVVDDIVDSGATRNRWRGYSFHALFGKTSATCAPFTFTESADNVWIDFPWEVQAGEGGEESVEGVQQNITRLLQYIGEDVQRDGLVDTPKRVTKALGELTAGYKQNPADLMTVFEETCDEMVVLRDIEFFSLCEHHMLPFYGRAHVAYVPDGKVIGVSKLARLVDLYARRLQIQERIGEQVTEALMHHLQPLGAACVIEARHLCMVARGVGKQNSVMTTSSLRGILREDPDARREFLSLIRSSL